MPINKIRFQPGLSLPESCAHFGPAEQAAGHERAVVGTRKTRIWAAFNG